METDTIPQTPPLAKAEAEKRTFGPADTPFDIGDGIRALSYYFGDAELNEMWCTNLYTVDHLRKLGYRGLKPQEAALQAQRDGKPGIIRFLFKRRPDRLLKIFTDQEKTLRDVDLEAVKTFDSLISLLLAQQIDREEFKTRVACLILKTRADFMNAWKHIDPLIQIENEGRVQTEKESYLAQGGKINHPGFRIISARASEKVKIHLKL